MITSRNGDMASVPLWFLLGPGNLGPALKISHDAHFPIYRGCVQHNMIDMHLPPYGCKFYERKCPGVHLQKAAPPNVNVLMQDGVWLRSAPVVPKHLSSLLVNLPSFLRYLTSGRCISLRPGYKNRNNDSCYGTSRSIWVDISLPHNGYPSHPCLVSI